MKGILSTPFAFYNNFQRQEEEEVKTVMMQNTHFDHDIPFVIRVKLMKFIFIMAQYWQRENSLSGIGFFTKGVSSDN